MRNSSVSLFAISAVTALALSACGGGGGGTPVAAAPAPAPAPAPPTAAQASDKYTGTWRGICTLSDVKQGSSTGALVYQRGAVTFAATGPTTSNVVLAVAYFAPTDTTCAQASVGSLTTNNNTFRVDGTTVIAGNTVDKVTVVGVAAFPGLSGGTGITINGLNYPNRYNTGSTDKNLAYVSGTTITPDDDGVRDAAGYPTALSTSPSAVLTKQ